MNTALWVLQIILAIKLISVSFTHGFRQSLPSMQEAIQKNGEGFPINPYRGCSMHIPWSPGIDPAGRFGVTRLDHCCNGSDTGFHAHFFHFLPC